MSFHKIPNVPHYAIITEVSVHIPGDQRSRDYPGHGYPSHTETYTNYEVFMEHSKWSEKVVELTNARANFHAIQAIPARIETKVIVQEGKMFS